MSAHILVLPTHGHVAAHVAQLALADPSGLAMGREAMTLGDLLAVTVAAALPDARVLSPLEERLLLRKVASGTVAAQGRFGAVSSSPGFVGALGSTLGACRMAGVGPAHLRSVIASLPPAAASRAEGVADLLEELDRLCELRGVLDWGRAVMSAARALRDGAALPDGIGAQARILVQHTHELFPARVELLDALASRLEPPGELVVELGHVEGCPAWFRSTSRLLSLVEARAAGASLTVLPVDPREGDGLGAWAVRALVDPAAAPVEPVNGKSVEVVHVPDPVSEYRVVARRVRALLDEGIPPERIGVAARALDAHGAGLTMALEDRGVPVHERRGTPAHLAPPVRWLLSLVRGASGGWSRGAAMRALCSDYAAQWLSTHGIDGGHVARVLSRIGVRPGPSGDGTRLLAGLDRLAASGDAPTGTAFVRAAVSSLVEATEPMTRPGTVLDMVARVRSLVEVCGLRQVVRRVPGGVRGLRRLIAHVDDPSAAAEAEALGRDDTALSALDAALDGLARAASTLELSEACSDAALQAMLVDALSEQSVAAGGLRGGAVRILGLRDLGGLDLDAVMLVGLRDGELPAPTPDDPLLPTSDRFLIARALAAQSKAHRWRPGIGGTTRAWSFDVEEDRGAGPVAFATRREEEPLVFIRALAAARSQLFLTRSRTDAGGRPAVASPLLEDAIVQMRAAGGTVVERSPGIEPAPSTDEAYGVEDVRRAAMRAVAEVPPGMTAVGAARAELGGLADGPDASLLGADLGWADILTRVAIERRRIAAMWAPGSIVRDEHQGVLSASAAALCDPTERALSASALEDLARCPFLYFVKRALGLGADVLAEDDPDARERGNVAHDCLRAAVDALLEHGIVPYRADLAEQAARVARAAALDVAVRTFASTPLEPSLLSVIGEELADRVAQLVERLYENGGGYTPVLAEHGFGFGEPGSWPALEVPCRSGKAVRIRGRIDLVERAPGMIRVVDLKSGGVAGLDKRMHPERVGCTELQLPLYAAAARHATGEEGADARYLSLRESTPTKRTLKERLEGNRGAWRLDERSERDVLDVVGRDGEPTALAHRVEALVSLLEEGRYEVRPIEGACDFCDYASVCRIPRGAPSAEEDA